MRSSRRPIVLLVTVLMALLAGCSNDPKSGSADASPAAAPSAPRITCGQFQSDVASNPERADEWITERYQMLVREDGLTVSDHDARLKIQLLKVNTLKLCRVQSPEVSAWEAAKDTYAAEPQRYWPG